MPDRSFDHSSFDPSRRFVRIKTIRDDGFVEFLFAIGDPELAAEMILPKAAFEQFAAAPGVETISDEEALRIEAKVNQYLYGDACPTPRQ